MGILSLLIGPLTNLLGRVLPDPAAAQAAKLKLIELTQQGALAELDGQVKEQLAAAGVVEAEAASKNWLASSWRPISMLALLAALIAHVFGWTSPTVTPAEWDKFFSLFKIGLGGYVIARSAEKITPSIASAIRGSKS